MNLSRTRSMFLHVYVRGLCRWTARPHHPIRVVLLGSHTYATHIHVNSSASAHNAKPTASSLLSNALDQKQRAARRQDSAGPFTLGITPPRADEVKPEKEWSELSVRGKVARTTARATNAVIILAGAGLSIVLIYALTSELFSRNSPTVLYNKACGLITASPMLHQYLQDPITFHNHPPTVSRPRHRNHYVSSQIFVDSTGREHMLLNFYVQGRPPGSATPLEAESENIGILSRLSQKARDLQEMSPEDIKDEMARRGERLMKAAKGMFRFLTGEEVARPPLQQMPLPEKTEVREQMRWFSSLTGVFSSIHGTPPSGGSSTGTYNGPMLTEGEVHADLVMNDQGYYEFRYLLIDMPNSNTRNPQRIFVQRKEGVRETEAVVRWHR